MKFKTGNPTEDPVGVEVVIASEETVKEDTPKKKDNSIADDYKKIIKTRLDLIEDSIRVIKDSFAKLDDLCDATDD